MAIKRGLPEKALMRHDSHYVDELTKRSGRSIRTILPLCLAYDHRVLDGADAVRFLKEVIAGLEAFDEADLQLK